MSQHFFTGSTLDSFGPFRDRICLAAPATYALPEIPSFSGCHFDAAKFVCSSAAPMSLAPRYNGKSWRGQGLGNWTASLQHLVCQSLHLTSRGRGILWCRTVMKTCVGHQEGCSELLWVSWVSAAVSLLKLIFRSCSCAVLKLKSTLHRSLT